MITELKCVFEMSIDRSIWFQKLFSRRFATKRPSLFLTQRWCPNAGMWLSRIVSQNGKRMLKENRLVLLHCQIDLNTMLPNYISLIIFVKMIRVCFGDGYPGYNVLNLIQSLSSVNLLYLCTLCVLLHILCVCLIILTYTNRRSLVTKTFSSKPLKDSQDNLRLGKGLDNTVTPYSTNNCSYTFLFF